MLMGNIVDYMDIKMVAVVKQNNIFSIVLFIWHGPAEVHPFVGGEYSTF